MSSGEASLWRESLFLREGDSWKETGCFEEEALEGGEGDCSFFS